MRTRRLAKGLGEHLGLLEQRQGGTVVARRVTRAGAVADRVGGQVQAATCPDRPIGIRAQLKALTAQGAPVVVCRVHQVAQGQLTGVLAGFEVNALLVAAHPRAAVVVVKD
jgi:hypothetical protein